MPVNSSLYSAVRGTAGGEVRGFCERGRQQQTVCSCAGVMRHLTSSSSSGSSGSSSSGSSSMQLLTMDD